MDHFCFCHAFVSDHCNLVVTFWERANPLALMYDVLYFVTSPCSVLGQVCYLIVSIPDLCLLTYFYMRSFVKIKPLRNSDIILSFTDEGNHDLHVVANF